jgi:hypothetical protein
VNVDVLLVVVDVVFALILAEEFRVQRLLYEEESSENQDAKLRDGQEAL